MHKSLEPEQYSQVLFNLVEQGTLTLSPLGRAGFCMPEERMSERTNPASVSLGTLSRKYSRMMSFLI